MNGGLLSSRIREYGPANAIEQENVLREVIQQLVLASLSRAGFFKTGAFHGGTCLRILHGMSRFSEVLDFLLKTPDAEFSWDPYVQRVLDDARADGLDFVADQKSGAGVTVRKALLRLDAPGDDLIRELPFSRDPRKKIRIKLEADTNPPHGSRWISQYITYPMTAAITTQDLPSAFATKSHALLCRGYTKGRDWYDFIWFVSKRVLPRFDLLQNAIRQQGPWAGQNIKVGADWYVEAMKNRIDEIDWTAARQDVSRFIPDREQESLELWDSRLFEYHVNRLVEHLGDASTSRPK